MRIPSIIASGLQGPPATQQSEGLKSGPTPQEVEVLERWHRDRINSNRGQPDQDLQPFALENSTRNVLTNRV